MSAVPTVTPELSGSFPLTLGTSRGSKVFLDVMNWVGSPVRTLGLLVASDRDSNWLQLEEVLMVSCNWNIWRMSECQAELDPGGWGTSGLFSLQLTVLASFSGGLSPCGGSCGCQQLQATLKRKHISAGLSDGLKLAEVAVVTWPSLNQSLGLERDYTGEPDLGHVAPEPG